MNSFCFNSFFDTFVGNKYELSFIIDVIGDVGNVGDVYVGDVYVGDIYVGDVGNVGNVGDGINGNVDVGIGDVNDNGDITFDVGYTCTLL